MSVEMLDGKITVVSPFKESPAEKAGLLPRDVILKINGTSTEGLTLTEAVTLIKGKTGTIVTLTIQRGTRTFDLKITRGYIITKTVELEFLQRNGGYVAHINVYTFGESTLKEFIRVAQQISDKQTQDRDVKGIILDLRNNPGGYLDVAIDMNGAFFDTNKIATILENNSGKRTGYKSTYAGAEKEYSTGMGLLSDFKTVVLINKGSASASEILAGALQINGVAKIVGERTYGKGTAQAIEDFLDGSSLHVTVYKWLLPDGTWINTDNPITPDYEVELTNEDFVEGKDPQLDKAIELLK